LCKICKGVDGHLTNCTKYKRREQKKVLLAELLKVQPKVESGSFLETKPGEKKKEDTRHTEKEIPVSIPPPPALDSKKMTMHTHHESEGLAQMLQQQRVQLTQLQLFMTSQGEKIREMMKTDLKEEIAKEIGKQTEELISQQTQKLNEMMDKIDQRLPQTHFDFVYNL